MSAFVCVGCGSLPFQVFCFACHSETQEQLTEAELAIAKLEEQLETARQIATVLMKDLEDVSKALGQEKMRPLYAQGLGGVVTDPEDLPGDLEQVKADFIKLGFDAGEIRKMGDEILEPEYKGGVLNLKTGEVKEGEPLADVIDRMKDGEAWRIVNSVFRHDKKAYEKLLTKCYAHGWDSCKPNLMKVVREFGDPRKW